MRHGPDKELGCDNWAFHLYSSATEDISLGKCIPCITNFRARDRLHWHLIEPPQAAVNV